MAGMLATLAAVCALLAVVLVSIGQATLAIPVAILLAILIAAGMFDAFAARRKVARHCGDVDSVEADEGDTFPTMVADEQAPIGATSQSHEDIAPHDLPLDHASRPAVKERSRERTGARTSGRDR